MIYEQIPQSSLNTIFALFPSYIPSTTDALLIHELSGGEIKHQNIKTKIKD